DRINVDNVVDIWVVANVTVNEDLISSCLTTIRGHIDDLIDDSRFVAYTEPKGMAMVICDESILSEVESSSENHESASSPTDQLLTRWLSNSESNTLGTSVDVVARFEDLISSLNLLSIPIEILGELSTKAIELNASKACMLNLAAAMKAPRQLSENTPTMLHSVDKNEELVILSRENQKYKVRYQWIFFASVSSYSNNPSCEVKLLHLENGVQCSAKSMDCVRWEFAMAVKHKYLFIFGGKNTQQHYAKCHFYDVTDDT
ncbi:unnamed protein product, partial [Hymenolepis diminuta]